MGYFLDAIGFNAEEGSRDKVRQGLLECLTPLSAACVNAMLEQIRSDQIRSERTLERASRAHMCVLMSIDEKLINFSRTYQSINVQSMNRLMDLNYSCHAGQEVAFSLISAR